jgi:hypothetical protein
MDRLHAAGNGQVPSVVATAWRLLSRLNAEVWDGDPKTPPRQ